LQLTSFLSATGSLTLASLISPSAYLGTWEWSPDFTDKFLYGKYSHPQTDQIELVQGCCHPTEVTDGLREKMWTDISWETVPEQTWRKILVSCLQGGGWTFFPSAKRGVGLTKKANSAKPGTSWNHSGNTSELGIFLKPHRSRSLQATSWGNAATKWVNLVWEAVILLFSTWASAWMNQFSGELVLKDESFTETVKGTTAWITQHFQALPASR